MIAGVAPQGHAPWLSMLLNHTLIDLNDGQCPLPWLAPSLTQPEGTISWTLSGNVYMIKHNNTLLICPGAAINGTPQPYVIGAGEVTSPL